MDFYKELSSFPNFRDAARSSSYQPMPDDWWVVITDVVNSSAAIERGRYKEVNTAGALTIVALINQNLQTHIPFVFGGDGVILLSPPELLEKIKDLLHCIRQFVKSNFDLELRIGMVQAAEIKQKGYALAVGKFSEVSPFQQAVFWGEGFEHAENLVKAERSKYLLPGERVPAEEPSYANYACPFMDIKSDAGNVVCLIVRKGKRSDDYEKSINELLDLLGNEEDYYPISFNNLGVGLTPRALSVWTTVAAQANKGWKYRWMGLQNAITSNLMNLKKKKMQETFSQALPHFSDHRKFDGAMKMVVNCNDQKLSTIRDWLDAKEQSGEILYGMHVSDSTLLTCLFGGNQDSKELHLVDGSKGGYALASKALKAKL